MKKQKYLFLEGEGDRWFERNEHKLMPTEPDPVIMAIGNAGIKPKSVLEVGCANGWRLNLLRTLTGCEVIGVEPSMKAAMEAAKLRVPVIQATASCMPLPGGYDLIIYGFCLYLTDPDDWLQIAADGDRLLEDGGHLVIYDFSPPDTGPYAKRYEHRDGVLSYHFDFAKLWLAHPQYSSVSSDYGMGHVIKVLRKSATKAAIPVLP